MEALCKPVCERPLTIDLIWQTQGYSLVSRSRSEILGSGHETIANIICSNHNVVYIATSELS